MRLREETSGTASGRRRAGKVRRWWSQSSLGCPTVKPNQIRNARGLS